LSARSTNFPCPYEFFLDGVKLPDKGSVNKLVVPREIAGMEIYSGPATIPVQYKSTTGGGFCGVILLWTRIGS
jgi:hypothetical protein